MSERSTTGFGQKANRRDRGKTLTGALTRRDVLKWCGAAGLGALAGSSWGEPAKSTPPNIVYVFSDQQRNASWPGGGESQVKTPNADRLAREGAVFNHCISTYPLCSPYRASMLTGRYPQATTITFNVPQAQEIVYDVGAAEHGLPTTEITIADILKKAGYATGYVGKWHLYPGGGHPVPPGPHRHGFDYWRVVHGYGDRWHTRWYDDDGKDHELPGYAPVAQMDQTLEFIEENADHPFLVVLSWHPPHSPYGGAPQEFIDLYPPDQIKFRPNVPQKPDMKEFHDAYVGYFSHVSAMDREMGRLMTKLAELGIADNTILVYTSDHGDMLGSHDLWAKRRPWDESINVPFFVRWPGHIPAGARLDQLFSTPDIAPTLLSLAGIPAPSQMQGLDFSPALLGKDMPGPESAFIMARGGLPKAAKDESQDKSKDKAKEDVLPKSAKSETAAPSDDDDEGGGKKNKKKSVAPKDEGQWRGVRTPRYTYARIQEEKMATPWVLFDNEKDPYQMHNLVDDPSSKALLKELDAMVDGWRKRFGEP